jgi:hypothetical protein
MIMKFIKRKYRQFYAWEQEIVRLNQEQLIKDRESREVIGANDANNPNSYPDSHLL